jgi:stearoyl-CoA desaturase (delta-9 desaturase)
MNLSTGLLLLVVAYVIIIAQISSFNTTVYLHRCKTHGGVELQPLVELVMHLELALFTGIDPREWVAVHRKHHQYSDKKGDPHSPRIYGVWHVLFGNAIYYRREIRNTRDLLSKYTPQWEPDSIDLSPRFKSALPLIGMGMTAVFFGGLFGLFGLSFWLGAVLGLAAWVVQAYVYILLNASINSICHTWGRRNYDNLATNVQALALVTAGEALHNNHHEYPSSARLSARRFEFDPGYALIRLLEILGLARADSRNFPKYPKPMVG